MKKFVLKILVFLAKRRLKESKAKVIGITGSVGKTTLKELIYFVIKDDYRTLRSEGNFNTEFGLPLSILELKEIPKRKIYWLGTVLSAFYNSYFTKFNYEYLVLEYGVDKPGDMDLLVKIAQPDIAIYTLIAPVHLDKGQFKSVDQIWKEKKKMSEKMPAEGLVLYNSDDPIQKKDMKAYVGCESIACGKDGRSSVEADHVSESKDGLSFEIKYDKYKHDIKMPKILGKYHARTACYVFALISRLPKIKPEKLIRKLSQFSLPAGRMNLIEGIKNSFIIDSSYNASPASMEQALEVLKHFSGRKIAALGQMNELGEESEEAHKKIGKDVSQIADILITVGKLGRIYAKSAVKNSPNKAIQIFSFERSDEAGIFLKELIKPNDIILVKGSQNNVRMEILIKNIMKNPDEARELLVRQGEKWT